MNVARAAVLGVSLMMVAAASPDILRRERWHHRLLLVFTPAMDDGRLVQQRAALADPGIDERDLVAVVVAGDPKPGSQDAALRAAFGVAPDRFAAILVGKDGGEKRRADRPISAASLFETIDRMPMARQERAARQVAP